MGEINWAKLLKQWNDYVLVSPLAEQLPADVRSSGWLGFAPATDQQLAAAEQRLGIPLPPSFRAFLKVSNGWRRATQAIERIWGTEDLVWFRTGHRDWISAYTRPTPYGSDADVCDEEYFGYGQRAEDFRRPHLKETLQISEVGDAAVYLLNPQVVSKDGEWEAWFFANWLPGVRRYRSFLEMMQAEFHQLAGIEWKQPVGVQGSLPDEYIGSAGSAKRRVKKRKKPRQEMVFGKPLKSWSVDELLAMLAREDFDIIHGEVITALGKLGDRRAVEPLLARLNENNTVGARAMSALKVLAPEVLPEPLLDILQRRPFWVFGTAAELLAELKEMRAVPLLVQALQDVCPEGARSSGYVGHYIVAFGKVGFDALVGLLQHEHPVVRCRAVSGLTCAIAINPQTVEIVRPLLQDPDPRVREIVESVLSILPVRPA